MVLARRPFPVAIGLRQRLMTRRRRPGRVKQRVLLPFVARLVRELAPDRGPRAPRDRSNTGIRGQIFRSPKSTKVTSCQENLCRGLNAESWHGRQCLKKREPISQTRSDCLVLSAFDLGRFDPCRVPRPRSRWCLVIRHISARPVQITSEMYQTTTAKMKVARSRGAQLTILLVREVSV